MNNTIIPPFDPYKPVRFACGRAVEQCFRNATGLISEDSNGNLRRHSLAGVCNDCNGTSLGYNGTSFDLVNIPEEPERVKTELFANVYDENFLCHNTVSDANISASSNRRAMLHLIIDVPLGSGLNGKEPPTLRVCDPKREASKWQNLRMAAQAVIQFVSATAYQDLKSALAELEKEGRE